MEDARSERRKLIDFVAERMNLTSVDAEEFVRRVISAVRADGIRPPKYQLGASPEELEASRKYVSRQEWD